MRRAFGKTIIRLVEKDSRIFLITGDVEQNIEEFKSLFPDNYMNAGLCEQSMVSMAAGMALVGVRPILYSITPFMLERAFEQIKVDVDEQNLPVMLIGYDDYPTHGCTHRALDPERMVQLLKNTKGFFPRNQLEAEKAMLDAYLIGGPSFIHLKRDGLPFF